MKKYNSKHIASKLLKIIAKEFNLSEELIMSKRRNADIINAKHIWRIALLSDYLNNAEVAKILNIDRTTIYNSQLYIASIKATEPELYARYELIKTMAQVELQNGYQKQINDKAYIAGKITGLDAQIVADKFAKAEAKLKKQHKQIVNPVTYCNERNLSGWHDCMQALLPEIATCNVMYVLPDYADSRGSLWEIAIAHNIYNIKIVKL
jgi:hypothetical protein